jgi:hypothetical protein
MRTQKKDMKNTQLGSALMFKILQGPWEPLCAKPREGPEKAPQDTKHAQLVKTCRKYQDEFSRCGGVDVFVDFVQMQLKNAGVSLNDGKMHGRSSAGMPGRGVAQHVRTDGNPLNIASLALACGAIGYAAYQHEKNQASFGEKDTIGIMLCVGDMHADNEDVQYMAREALEYLIQNNSKNRETYMELGGMKRAWCSQLANALLCTESHGQADGQTKVDKNVGNSMQNGCGMTCCMGCGKTAEMVDGGKLLLCSACTLAPSYCSVACQKACWKMHKVECKANRKHG